MRDRGAELRIIERYLLAKRGSSLRLRLFGHAQHLFLNKRVLLQRATKSKNHERVKKFRLGGMMLFETLQEMEARNRK